MGSWKGRGNQYIQFVRVLYCKLPTNGKQLPAFPHKAMMGIEPQPQRWEARVKTCCKHWLNQKILLSCDIIAMVNAFSHHKMRNPWLTACIRNTWYFTASYNIDLEVKHILGKLNLHADVLSCWDVFHNQDSTVVKFLKSCEWETACPTMLYPNFNI